MARERLKLDLELAREVQRGFLPLRLPEVSGYEFFAHYEPASEVGGDYYDFIPLPRQRVAILLGDVAGKGVAAALLMAKLSRRCPFLHIDGGRPGSRCNPAQLADDPLGISDRFVSLLAAILDPASHTVTLVNAGHPSPLIYRRATCTVEEAISTEATGLPLGIVDGFEYTSCQVSLDSGDCLLAFTDGVTEAMDVNNVQLQTQGIHAAVQGAAYSPGGSGSGWSRSSRNSPPAAASTTTLPSSASAGRARH